MASLSNIQKILNCGCNTKNRILMEYSLKIYNTLSRNKELFIPLNPPYVGLYCCGPTVYSDVHLGNTRTFISIDLVYRYLKYLGFKVRYVRNITDAGHLTNDQGQEANEKENINWLKGLVKLEKLEPMEIVQKYTVGFHEVCKLFNLLTPTIEPTATGHIVEQIEMTQQLIDNGVAYESNGSVYFDIKAYNAKGNKYGTLSGRNIEDLIAGYRDLDGQDEKRYVVDFALWKKASPEHIMQWNSPWGNGFPGWHMECTVLSTKYLGKQFDIHAGGMDLKFPHHDCEIAQNVGVCGNQPALYWMHTNMINFNGQKMSKSLDNSILPMEFITGNHPMLDKPYSAMVIRFLLLQSHYASELDITIKGLQDAEKGYKRLMSAINLVSNLKTSDQSSFNLKALRDNLFEAMCDDFNTPVVIRYLFEATKIINSINGGGDTISELDKNLLTKFIKEVTFDILGLIDDSNKESDKVKELTNIILKLRKDSRKNKDWGASDNIRDELLKIGIKIKDNNAHGTLEDETEFKYDNESKFTTINIPENFRGIFQDFLLGFENYCKLKGQDIRISMDNSQPNKIGFLVSIKDPSKILDWQLDVNWKEYIEKVNEGDSFESMPEVISKDEHSVEIGKLQRRVKYIENEFKLIQNKFGYSFNSQINSLQDTGFKTSLDKIESIKATKLFVSYSKHDIDDLQDFEDHLVTLKEERLITSFNCREIEFGKEWDEEIKKQIDECDILVCLVSVKFLNAPYITKIELPKAIEKNKIIIPIIIKACDWETSKLGTYQAALRGNIVSLDNNQMLLGKIKSHNSEEKAAFWTAIIKELRKKVFNSN